MSHYVEKLRKLEKEADALLSAYEAARDAGAGEDTRVRLSNLWCEKANEATILKHWCYDHNYLIPPIRKGVMQCGIFGRI
jgi:hypothetical protein